MRKAGFGKRNVILVTEHGISGRLSSWAVREAADNHFGVALPVMRKFRAWLSTRFTTFLSLPDYFRAIAKQWINVLFGETLVGVVFLLWWALSNPKNPPLILVFVAAMFMAGYYAWLANHSRLVPKFEVRAHRLLETPVVSTQTGHVMGSRVICQLLPKCLTAANVEECVGFLTQVSRWDEKNGWEVIEDEPHALEWSLGNEEPITLYAGAEARLNVYHVDNVIPYAIRPNIIPYPSRLDPGFTNTFGAEGSICAYRLRVQLMSRDCSPVDVQLKVQSGPDVLRPWVTLGDLSANDSIEANPH